MEKKIFSDQIDKILAAFAQLKAESKYNDFSDLDEERISELITKVKAAIARISSNNSEYYKDVVDVLKKSHIGEGAKLVNICGTLKALKDDLENDYLKSIAELIHADIFLDYIEMSIYLLNEGYKDPAAVLLGSTLEAHLRELCKYQSIDIEIQNSKGKLVAKRADVMNSDLTKASCYSSGYQKQITAWLDIRNNAAHGKYEKYNNEEVQLMALGIRSFVLMHPA